MLFDGAVSELVKDQRFDLMTRARILVCVCSFLFAANLLMIGSHQNHHDTDQVTIISLCLT